MIVRWGVIGPGRIAAKFAEALSAVDGSELHGVASRSRARATAFADRYGAKASYHGYDDLAADDAVDAVYVATPHRFHFENVMLCLKAGKHVLCEKPLAVNETQAAEMVREARARGLVLMEALWTRFLPIYREVRAWLNNGRIGDVRLAHSAFSVQIGRDPNGRLLNMDLAGGALLDLGVYNIAISQWLFGSEPKAVGAVGYLGETGVDEIVSGTLDYGSGRMSQFVCGFLANMDNDLRIYGTRGQIRIHDPFWGAVTATLTSRGNETTVSRSPARNGFEYQIAAVVECIREGRVESDVMPHAHSLANARLMDQIRSKIGLVYPFE